MIPLPALSTLRDPAAAAALLDPVRRAIVAHLAEPDSAAGLARRMGVPRQRLNYHLRELERAGLLECVDQRRKGNCVERVMRATAQAYVISPEVLGSLNTAPAAAADRMSAAALVDASARTIRDVAALEAGARQAGQRLATLTLEAEVRFAGAEQRARFTEELTAALAALITRYHDDTAPDGRRFRLVLGAHPVRATAPADRSPPSTEE